MNEQSEQMIYVEDDAVLASVTARALQKRGYGVAHVAGVKAARELNHLPNYDWALLDLKLEDGSSLELIEHLLQQQPDMKIVVLTGYASIATAVQAIKLGAINYLAKPATIEQILNAFGDDASSSADDDTQDNVFPLRRMEWEHIQQVLAENDGNISATARQLKMHRRTLQRKLSKKPVSD